MIIHDILVQVDRKKIKNLYLRVIPPDLDQS